jgi:hypothetical protein
MELSIQYRKQIQLYWNLDVIFGIKNKFKNV